MTVVSLLSLSFADPVKGNGIGFRRVIALEGSIGSRRQYITVRRGLGRGRGVKLCRLYSTVVPGTPALLL